jgi:GcrA cell cycle regulator
METMSQIQPGSSTPELADEPRARPPANGAAAPVCNDGPPLTDAELRRLLAPFVSGAWSMEPLLTLWREWHLGTPTRIIGAKCGVSKNAVVGKAHRLGDAGTLPGRPSPIIRDPDDWAQSSNPGHQLPPRPPRPPPAPRHTLPPLASGLEPPHAAAPAIEPPKPGLAAAPKPRGCGTGARPAGTYAPPPLPSIVAPAQAAAPRYGRVTECCWPIGTPGKPTFHFCDAPSRPGSPYCASHHAKAYVRVGGHAASAAAEASP